MIGFGAYSAIGGIENILNATGSDICLLADDALKLNPQSKTIVGRITVQAKSGDIIEQFRDFAGQPLPENSYELGQSFAQRVVTYCPKIKIWQGYNEPVNYGDYENYKRLALFELGFTRKLHELGRKSCVLNLGVGVAQPEDYPVYFKSVLNEADYVGFHSYGDKIYQLMSKDPVWYALRYRLCAEECKKAGVRFPPIIITECTTFYGWRGKFKSEVIRDDILWLANECKKDNVVGIIGFQVGSLDKSFEGFNLDDPTIIKGVADYNKMNPSPVQANGDILFEFGNHYEIKDVRCKIPRNGKFPRRNLNEIKYIVIHHSASEDFSAQALALYHMGNGWPSAGYHILIHPDGNAELLNSFEDACYNVAYKNASVLGICLVGNFNNYQPTSAQLVKAHDICAELQFMLGWFCPIVGHKEIADPKSPTSCPGSTFDKWKSQLTNIVIPQFQYVLGFKELSVQLGFNIVGNPEENEYKATCMLQRTNTGIMLYEMGKQPEFYLERN